MPDDDPERIAGGGAPGCSAFARERKRAARGTVPDDEHRGRDLRRAARRQRQRLRSIRPKSGEDEVASLSIAEFYSPVAGAAAEIRHAALVRDPETGRIFHSGVTTKGQTSSLVLAVSRSADPASLGPSDWWHYALPWKVDAGGRSIFEWPRLTLTRGSVVVTSKTDPPSSVPIDGLVLVLDKDALLRGDAAPRRAELAPEKGVIWAAFRPLDPVDAAYAISAGPGDPCTLTVWRIDETGSSRSSRRLPSASPCVPALDVPQPNGPRPLDVLFERVRVDAVLRGGSIWGAQTAARAPGTPAVVHWFEIDVSRWPDGVQLRQEGWIADATAAHFYPGVTASADGHLAIVLSRAGPSEAASLALFGSYVTDEGERGTWVANLDVRAR